jgi:hypothetical protein
VELANSFVRTVEFVQYQRLIKPHMYVTVYPVLLVMIVQQLFVERKEMLATMVAIATKQVELVFVLHP